MKPNKEDRKKFDIDLEYGEIREDKIKDMLTGKKIEVKSEKGMWMKTGNICIEYESWNNHQELEQQNQTIGFITYV